MLHRALRRLEEKGRGILLLHDIHARTASMLPKLLRELKARGFHIVHVVPGRTPSQPPVETAKVMVASATPEKLPIPRLLSNDAESVPAIEEKARQIASLGATRKHARPEPAAPHIRGSKPGKPVQTAAILPTGVEAGVLR